jgi:hypothetical protein
MQSTTHTRYFPPLNHPLVPTTPHSPLLNDRRYVFSQTKSAIDSSDSSCDHDTALDTVLECAGTFTFIAALLVGDKLWSICRVSDRWISRMTAVVTWHHIRDTAVQCHADEDEDEDDSNSHCGDSVCLSVMLIARVCGVIRITLL